ncbi:MULTISPECIES: hypothetical protein [Streptomyces]|uniref:hypothetical protein n=1 Tax=Streptomyces TaxID=1883 RepID=UPI001EFE2BFD|nr:MULTISPECIES: hypothetical protein [unclassified Streptomyces]
MTDFPFREELSAELRPRLEELVRETGDGGDAITRPAGWKLGGWPTRGPATMCEMTTCHSTDSVIRR